MARISGVDLPREKQIQISLTYLFGIGKKLHEEPQVPNYAPSGWSRGQPNPRMRPGMVLAVEPMINLGTHLVETLPDGWTVVTQDGKLSAHWEHTIAVTEDGPQVLTRR